MTIEEWKESASKEALEQYNKPIEWFKTNVKCCYNCPNWDVDWSLKAEYKYNSCRKIMGTIDGFIMTPFDAFCKDYAGLKTIDNLLDYAEYEEG